MASIIGKLTKQELITPPKFLCSNIQYETIMGSVAYGVSSDVSDLDVYGFAIPPKNMIFPHLDGEIYGFGTQKKRFDQYQEHHINYADGQGGRGQNVDVSIYNIVKYFQLCMENNPNMIDSLFTTANCVLHITKIGNMVKDNRKIFLHKGSWHKFKGYAYSQLHKMSNKNPIGKRKELVDKYGYDIKFAYHVIRLIHEVEQILIEGDIDLTKHREQLKSIRRGEWKEQDIRDYFNNKEKDLEKVYVESTLQHGPDEYKIKELLLNCLEEHYGDMSKCVFNPDKSLVYLKEIKNIIEKSEI